VLQHAGARLVALRLAEQARVKRAQTSGDPFSLLDG
jgi:hypothetical protein